MRLFALYVVVKASIGLASSLWAGFTPYLVSSSKNDNMQWISCVCALVLQWGGESSESMFEMFSVDVIAKGML